MATAYMLITCDLGCEAEVIDEIKQLEDVKEATRVYGIYDILAKVESANVKNINDTITSKIRKLNRVRSMLTLMTTEGQE